MRLPCPLVVFFRYAHQYTTMDMFSAVDTNNNVPLNSNSFQPLWMVAKSDSHLLTHPGGVFSSDSFTCTMTTVVDVDWREALESQH
jgi:hypothetical protein